MALPTPCVTQRPVGAEPRNQPPPATSSVIELFEVSARGRSPHCAAPANVEPSMLDRRARLCVWTGSPEGHPPHRGD